MKSTKQVRAALASLLMTGAMLMSASVSAASGTHKVAVIAFDYSDSSGEPEDQTAEHAARLALFRKTLEADLDEAGSLDTATIPCMARDCTISTMRAADLLAECRAAGLDFLVFGGVHKMSTLVGGGRVLVLDVAENKFVFERMISFRGDDDEAFVRAARFSAREIVRTVAAEKSDGH
ncbi:DUF2380 domain-containing protein [Jiella pacifica]|uniref:DUF2380 domain-containing protein n=1 Tax=Jiella pacifica TaxID=2696469 RepID=A0A6N9TBY9_9HYPH|nr:DUF2380 domain-containing protein [Jiella pacifica]NDW07189.1 DUF2380 domain-containing protein [Jiella pacifica]